MGSGKNAEPPRQQEDYNPHPLPPSPKRRGEQGVKYNGRGIVYLKMNHSTPIAATSTTDQKTVPGVAGYADAAARL